MSFTVIQLGGYSSKVRMLAFAAGVAALGGTVVIADSDHKLENIAAQYPVRFAFTCGMKSAETRDRDLLAARKIPLLVLDLGYFGRALGAADPLGYNQLGLGHLCWAPTIDVASDRFDAFRLKIAPAKRHRPGDTVLVLGQVPGDTQHHLSSDELSRWLTVCAAYYAQRGYKLLYRPHPRAPSVELDIAHMRIDPTTSSVSDNLAAHDVSLAITYNSTSGLEMLMAGIAVDCAPCAHYAHVADLSDPAAFRQHLHRLAYAQWTCAELRTGDPIRWMNRFAALMP